MNKHNSVPNMRFNGFEDEWKVIKINYIVNIKAGGDLEKNKLLKDGKYPVIGNTLKNNGIIGYTNTFKIEAPAVTVTGRGEIGKAFYQPIPFTPVVRLLALVPKNKNIDMKFLSNEIENLNFFSESTGVPQLTAPELGTYKVGLTECSEQQKIGNFFAKLDKLLDLQQQKIDKLELLKKALLQKLFPKHDAKISELRFKGFEDVWESMKFKNILNYERPDKYIVKSDNYSNNGIPVLTANKSFILGYTQESSFYEKPLPIIIFDDFTLDCKLVKFPFKIKSSAIKILSSNNFSDIWFDFYLLKATSFIKEGHARHYISIVQNKKINVPCEQEQQKIGNLLSKVDQLIELENKKLQNFQQVKKCLLQNMFVD